MAVLNELTLAQLQAMTKAQLIAAIAAYFADDTSSEFVVNEATAGLGPIRRVEVVRNRLTGKALSRKHLDWTYYPTTEVDTITISERDAADVETRRYRIRHFCDGLQPVLEEG